MAYGYQIEPNRIVDAPQWAKDQRYEINARTRERKPGKLLPMMRNLLAERFALKVQRDCAQSAPTLNGCSHSFGVGRYRASGQEWKAFVNILEVNLTGRPITDKTGLSGQFDITVEWNPDISRVPESIINPPTLAELEARPILFTAMREQLGLKVEPGTHQSTCS